MWGANAVGKLVAGADPLKPQVEAFVDEEAGPEVAEKVKRRLQHFIDRKVAAQFEPLMALSRDEALQGLARGFAFRLVEGLGVVTRESVADDVKALDQEARSSLRKHGVRFGQYTIFLPLLLKPAPTRLRLVLWSLAKGLQEFPESPPPGLVTIPNIAEVPKEHYTLAGYRPAGARAIRIDMLERLADQLRAKDSRAGFEATADMLSITGMTLEQFADLMGGLGYKGEKAERVKVRKAEVPAVAEGSTAPIPEEVSVLAPVIEEVAVPAEGDEAVEAPAPEMETFYTFTWAPRPRHDHRGPRREGQGREGQGREGQAREGQGREGQAPRGDRPARGPRPEGGKREDRPRGEGQPRREGAEGGKREGGKRDFGGKRDGGKPDHAKGPRRDQGKDGQKSKTFEARPPRAEKPIDPDNPFAALLALKGKV